MNGLGPTRTPSSNSLLTSHNSQQQQPVKSKMEKIAELEATLKVSKEENRRLKKQVHSLKRGSNNNHHHVPENQNTPFPHWPSSQPSTNGTSRRPSGSSQVTMATTASSMTSATTDTTTTMTTDVAKMKDALKALKRVTIQQELSLQSLRTKASQRRSELEARDLTIAKLQKQIAVLRRANGSNNNPNSNNSNNSNSADVIRRLQDGLMDEESKNVELTGRLQQTEAKVKSLEQQVDFMSGGGNASASSLPVPSSPMRMTPVFKRESSLSSLKSTLQQQQPAPMAGGGGVTTNSDTQSVTSGSATTLSSEFDVSKLKKEVARKSNRIVQLEYELEETKDELHQVKQQLMRQRHKQSQPPSRQPHSNGKPKSAQNEATAAFHNSSSSMNQQFLHNSHTSNNHPNNNNFTSNSSNHNHNSTNSNNSNSNNSNNNSLNLFEADFSNMTASGHGSTPFLAGVDPFHGKSLWAIRSFDDDDDDDDHNPSLHDDDESSDYPDDEEDEAEW